MKAVLLVLAVIAAVMIFTLPGKDAKINKRITQCTRSLSAQNNPLMSKIDKPAFCGCVAHSFEEGKELQSDIAVIKPCIDKYVRPTTLQTCEEIGTKAKTASLDCSCFYDKLATVIMNHADAARNHRKVTPTEQIAEQKQFLQCKKAK